MGNRNKIFLASDFHLGSGGYEKSLAREKKIVRWLDGIQAECKELYLLGDIFDFWFEYNHTIPKYYIRFLGKLSEFADKGIPIHIMVGNHDMWMFGYLEKELRAKIYFNEIEREFFGKSYYLAHGDGLGPGDKKYKFLKKIFRANWAQWCFARLHPNFSFWLAQSWSQDSRQNNEDPGYLGDEKEWLVQFSHELLKEKHRDYFVYGHRHLPLKVNIANSIYFNLGDWMNHFSYLEIDEAGPELKYFKD